MYGDTNQLNTSVSAFFHIANIQTFLSRLVKFSKCDQNKQLQMI